MTSENTTALSSSCYNFFHHTGHINYESPICMLTSFIIWRCLYDVFRFFLYEKGPEYSSRIISFLHAMIASFMGINQCFLFDWPFDHPEWKTSYTQSFIMTSSFGYFLHDLIWIVMHDRRDKVMLAHHIVCVWALWRMLFKGYSGGQATCALGSLEITNPFLQARWFLRTEGMHGTPVFISTEITFILVFVTLRLILGSYFLNTILKQPKNDWDFIVMSVAIYVLSWLFLCDMIKYALKKYLTKSNVSSNVSSNVQKEDDSKTN